MRKRYDKEFKIEAVRLASEPGNTQAGIERDLGISQGIISRWNRKLLEDGEQPFREKAALRPMAMNCGVSIVKMSVSVGSVIS